MPSLLADLILFFSGAALVFLGWWMRGKQVTVNLEQPKEKSTFHSEVLDSYETWEEEKQ